MIFQKLNLIKFRNHAKASFDFVNGVNLIVGSNGTGKTNILEAIDLLSTGKSFRAHYDQEMVYNPDIAVMENQTNNAINDDLTQKKFSKVVGSILSDKNEETLEILIVKGNPYTNLSQKTFKVNGTPKPIYETAKYFSTVLFCPQDLDLFNGSPALRRKFLDNILCTVDPKYKKEHMVYTKAVRQRNKILEKINKTARGGDELSFWTDELLKTGTYLQEKRSGLIQTLNNTLGPIYSKISSRAIKVHVDYKVNHINLERLEKHREHEIYAKTTLVGPHRDDFDFLTNGFSISHYGSRGQQRTGVLALKMCELDVISTTHNAGQNTPNPPVLLLDDIFSELDDAHKKALEAIVHNQQTIISSTHPDIKAQNTTTL